jgi:hypothetical protein
VPSEVGLSIQGVGLSLTDLPSGMSWTGRSLMPYPLKSRIPLPLDSEDFLLPIRRENEIQGSEVRRVSRFRVVREPG